MPLLVGLILWDEFTLKVWVEGRQFFGGDHVQRHNE
jgi:hypothetical protein